MARSRITTICGGDRCYRSHNWAERYTAWLRSQGHPVTLVNRACNGGVTRDFTASRDLDTIVQSGTECKPQSPDEQVTKIATIPGPIPGTFLTFCHPSLRPQIDSLDHATDLVVFTFGGNDIHFKDIVEQCFIVAKRHPRDCRDKVTDAEAALRPLVQDRLVNVLVVPWFLLYMARGMLHLRGSVAEQARAERLYGRLSGKDPHVAQAEVFRMVEQLGQLDAREHWLDEDAPGPQKGADRAELEAAADALLGYYLAGRRTDDELLGEVQAAWGEYEALTHERAQRVLEEGPRRGRPRPDHEERVQAARDRHLLAWRRWLDRQAPRASSSGSGRQ